MSFKKIFWLLLLSSLVSYCSLKEKTPEAVFEDALEDPQSDDAAGFCAAIDKVGELEEIYDYMVIPKVFSTQNDSNIRCYINRAVQAGGQAKENVTLYAYRAFQSGKEDKIDAMLRNGLDPDLIITTDEEARPVEAYYLKTNGSRIIEVKEKAPGTLLGKVGNNPTGTRTHTTKRAVPDIQYSGLVKFPDVLKSFKEVKLYLRSKGYPEDGLRIIKRYEPYCVKPLDIAIHKDNMALIRQLLEYGADVSKSNWAQRPVAVRRDDVIYPLLTLAQQNWGALDQIIIRDDVDSFRANLAGSNLNEARLTTVIDSLFTHQSPKILAEAGKMDQFNFIYQQLDYLVKAYQTGNPDILKFMLDGGADLSTPTTLKQLPKSFVHLSRYYEDNEDRDLKGSIGSFMIAHALENKAWKLAQTMEAHWHNWLPVHYAALQKDGDRLKQLLAADPTLVDLPDDLGQTPLMLAAKYHCNYITMILLEHGSDASKQSKAGKTAAMYAIDCRNEWAVKALVQERCDRLSTYAKDQAWKQYFFPQFHYLPGDYYAEKELKRRMVLNHAYLDIIRNIIASAGK